MFKKILLFILASCFLGFNDSPKCFKQLEIDFFNEKYVYQAFDLYTFHNVYQGDWGRIVRKLKEEQLHIPNLVKLKTRGMRPNPLEHPFQPQKAKEVLLEAYYEVFYSVVKSFVGIPGVTAINDESIRGMFNYILEKQEARIDACLGEKMRRYP